VLNHTLRKIRRNPMRLSSREREITLLLIRGYADKEICSRLDIRASTLRTHLSRMFRRADVSSRGEFVARIMHASERRPTEPK
jgi:DNA-binding CsgD family transcriptional regulator